MKPLILTLQLLLFFTISGFSLNPEWIQYTCGEDVSCIAIEEHVIWIGTLGGLVKLDKSSANITFYNPCNSGLPDIRIRSITIDGSGNKWIGTNGSGLALFDGTNWTVYNIANSGLQIPNS